MKSDGEAKEEKSVAAGAEKMRKINTVGKETR